MLAAIVLAKVIKLRMSSLKTFVLGGMVDAATDREGAGEIPMVRELPAALGADVPSRDPARARLPTGPAGSR